MVEIATNRRWGKNKKKKHEHDAKYGFYKYRTRFAIKNGSNVYEIYNSTIVIRNSEDGKKYLYDIIKIKRDNDVRLAATSYEARYGEAVYPSSNDIISNNVSIPNSENNVNSHNAQTKEKFSLKGTD